MKRTQAVCATLVLLCALCLFSPGIPLHAQEHSPEDTTPQVGALSDFHVVIAKIWHTAWPNKDTAMLRALLPDVERGADSLRRATLPGILRDKQTGWNEAVAQLQLVVKEYASASAGADSQRFLDAAEKLHAQYEKMVRLTRPVLRELDEFHRVLYVLYHHVLPAKNQEKIAASVVELKAKMALLEQAKLAERMKSRQAAFAEARGRLVQSVGALDAAKAKSDPAKFAADVETMHGDYQMLEKVFE
jgi:hypothetical protein